MTTRITMEEWLAAITLPVPTGHTTEELAQALGYSESHFRLRVRPKMIKAGILRTTGLQRTDSGARCFYELLLPKDARQRLLNVGVAVPSRERRGGVRKLSDMVAQLTQQQKRKR